MKIVDKKFHPNIQIFIHSFIVPVILSYHRQIVSQKALGSLLISAWGQVSTTPSHLSIISSVYNTPSNDNRHTKHSLPATTMHKDQMNSMQRNYKHLVVSILNDERIIYISFLQTDIVYIYLQQLNISNEIILYF